MKLPFLRKRERAARPGRSSGAGVYFALAGLLALGAGLIVAFTLRQTDETATVWVAAKNLQPGLTVVAADFKTKEVPLELFPSDSLDPKTVEGRRLTATLIEGDLLRAAHVAPDDGSDLPGRLAELGDQTRAVVLPIDAIPAAGRLSPGDQVELTAVLPYEEEQKSGQLAMLVTSGQVLELLHDNDGKVLGVLLAVDETYVSALALSLRAGSVTAAINPAGVAGRSDNGQRLRLDQLTGTRR